MKSQNPLAVEAEPSKSAARSSCFNGMKPLHASELTSPSRPSNLAAMPAHVGPADAAKYLGVSEQTLAIWRCTKRYPLPYIKIGRLVRYRLSDLEAFLVLRTIEASSGKSEA